MIRLVEPPFRNVNLLLFLPLFLFSLFLFFFCFHSFFINYLLPFRINLISEYLDALLIGQIFYLKAFIFPVFYNFAS